MSSLSDAAANYIEKHKQSLLQIGLWTRLKQKMDECHSKYWTAEIEALVI